MRDYVMDKGIQISATALLLMLLVVAPAQADGFSLDDKRERVAENDIPDVLERWGKRDVGEDTDRTAKAFFVPVQEIVENEFDLSINRYKEITYEEAEYEAPDVIIGRLRKIENTIAKDLGELEEMLRE